MKIFIDWKAISTEEEYYNSLLEQLKAPDWHGHNLDALANSLINGDINGVEPPFCIINLNVQEVSAELTPFFQKVGGIYSEARDSGRVIRVFEE